MLHPISEPCHDPILYPYDKCIREFLPDACKCTSRLRLVSRHTYDIFIHFSGWIYFRAVAFEGTVTLLELPAQKKYLHSVRGLVHDRLVCRSGNGFLCLQIDRIVKASIVFLLEAGKDSEPRINDKEYDWRDSEGYAVRLSDIKQF